MKSDRLKESTKRRVMPVRTSLLTLGLLGVWSGSSRAADDVIVVQGKPDQCEKALGEGWTQVVNPQTDEIEGCRCTNSFYCNQDDEWDWDFGDLLPPTDGGGGYGPPDPDDECAAEDSACVCEAAEPEPEICEVPGCAECSASFEECREDVTRAVQKCTERNLSIAEGLCMASLRNYSNLEECVDGLVHGRPSWEHSTSFTDKFGWKGEAGVKFPIKVVEVTLGGGISGSSADTHGIKTGYPSQPPKGWVQDCHESYGNAYNDCAAEQKACENTAAQGGETCDEE